MMVLSARIALLIVGLVLSSSTKAVEVTCIGKSDDPNKNFYAKKLDALTTYTQEATEKLNKLRIQNDELDVRINSLQKVRNDLVKSSNATSALTAKKEIAKLIVAKSLEIQNLNLEKQANFNSLPMTKDIRKKNEKNPEDYLKYHGINEINKHLSELRFIATWWYDQGLEQNTKISTAGKVCEDCQNPLFSKMNSGLSSLKKLITVPKIKEDCVSKSIEYKKAENAEVMCENSSTQKGSTRNICVTQNMASYTQWALNKAFQCLGTAIDPIDPQIIFRKLNNESTFRFFYSYNGGQGLMQTITCAQDEVLGLSPSTYCGSGHAKNQYRSQARKELVARMDVNADKCDIYKNIIDFKQEAALDSIKNVSDDLISEINKIRKDDPKYNELKLSLDKNKELYNKQLQKYPLFEKRLFNPKQHSSCDFLSLQDGIHRNVLAGLGLYLHYRSLADQDLTSFLGANIKKNPQYNKIRDLTALVYYGPSGPGGAKINLAKMIPSIKAKYKHINKMSPADYENKLRDQFKYIRAINKSDKVIDDKVDEDKIQCVE